MKKITIILCVLCVFVGKSFAQVPNQFNYQAVARNSAGQSIPNANIRVRFTILDGSATGINVYSEVRQLTTNQLGLFTAAIGGTGAINVTGNFATINWSTGSKFIKVEADPLGGTNFILLGNTEMLSVPYALYAVNGKIGPQGIQGPIGLTGATGVTGPQGIIGLTGATGATGTTGPQGIPGKNTLILTTTEPAGANCTTGGVKQEYGIDANGNGTLEPGEINAALTKYVCNGLAGTVANAWSINGNAGTTAANFIGTTDDQPLRFAMKGGSAGIIDSALANTALGVGALRENTTGHFNTAIGFYALNSNTTGVANTANGMYALVSNTTGNNNTGTGFYALLFNTTGFNNTAHGNGALRSNTTGYNNTAQGNGALSDNTTGFHNTAIGNGALNKNIDGNRNNAIGREALFNNTTGFDNTANGNIALLSNTTGGTNTATGSGALSSNTTGFANTATGYQALRSNTTGFRNTGIGRSAGEALPNNINNVSCFGYNAGFATTGSNQINIGDMSVTAIGGQVTWSTYSDGRIKNNITENVPGLNFIKALRPVTYNVDIIKQDAIANAGAPEIKDKDGSLLYKALNRSQPEYPEQFDIEKITQTGFIAQEVEAAAKKSGYNFSGVQAPKDGKGLYSLRYAEFVVPLVKAVQEQQQIIDLLQKQVEAAKAEIPVQIGKQQQQIEVLQEQNNELLKRLTSLENKK
jgi:trimeric autotransporter adhesin